jgi:hypothetical protein
MSFNVRGQHTGRRAGCTLTVAPVIEENDLAAPRRKLVRNGAAHDARANDDNSHLLILDGIEYKNLMPLRHVCVFCGSSAGVRREYRAAAEALARELVARRIGLVYGGGAIGLMGLLADAVLGGGGRVVGVIPHALVAREIAHRGLSDLRVVQSMHERKAVMADLADAFVALPGGFGTFEELCEAITWTQLGLHRKRCGLLNVGGFYDPLLAMFDRAVSEGFIRPSGRDIVVDAVDPAALIDLLSVPPDPVEGKWLRSADET